MRKSALVGIVLAMWTTAGAAHAAGDYAAAGPEAFTTSSLASPTAGAQGGYLVVPNAAGSYPLLVTSHGFSANADNQKGWAEHFASWGFVVVVPNFPSTFAPDTNTNRDVIKALVALYSNASTTSPAQGKVDAAHVGLEGHSAGGLATAVAAAGLKPGATVLFDPVDKDDAGKAAYGTLCTPVLSLFADPSSCNNTAGWSAYAATPTGIALSAHIVGSTHCDGENQDRPVLCGSVCGGAADPVRQAVYARYATAFFLAHLRGDAAATTSLASLASDPALSSPHVATGSPCMPSSPSDGGVPTSDDGGVVVPEAGVSDDAGAAGPIGDTTPAATGDSPGSSSGCACRAASPASSSVPASLLLVGVAGLALVRGRRKR